MSIAVWGDSIAKGIVFDDAAGRYRVCRNNCLSMLAANTGIRILNHSVMGNTTEDGLKRIDNCPETVTVIEYGGNDCDLDWKRISEDPDTRQYGKVPIGRFRENLKKLIETASGNGSRPVPVIAPPIVAQRYFDHVSKGLNAANILKYLGSIEEMFLWQESYAEAIRETAEEQKTAVADIRGAFLGAGDYARLFCSDGIHPNEQGHALMYDYLISLIG